MADPKLIAAVAPDGTPIEIPAAEAGVLARSEGHVMSPVEEAKARREVDLQNKLGGIEGYVAPALVGAARGLTFGLSDHALASAPGMRSRLEDYEEFAPAAIKGGEFAGMTAGALFGVGAPALIERAGVAAERAGLGMVGRGAAEGALFGESDAISDAALTDHGLTGEAMIGGAAHGALGGAIAMGALGALGKAAKSFKPSASKTAEGFEALAGTKYGEAADGVGTSLADVTAEGGPYRSSSSLGDVAAQKYIDHLPTATSAERSKYAETWAARERVLQKGDQVVEDGSRNLSQALDEALIAGRKVDMASFGEAKINHMAKMVDVSRSPEQASLAYNWVREADPIIQSLRTDANSAMTAGDLKQWNGWVKEIGSAVKAQDSIQMQTTLDQMKRWMGKQAEFGSSPIGVTRAAREFEALYHGTDEMRSGGLKGLLESEVWGERAARAQRDVNAATTNMLGEGKRFSRKYTTEGPGEAGRATWVADTAAVSGFMGRLTSAANDLDAKSFESWVQTRRHFLDATTRSYEHDAGTLAAVARERAALEKLDNVYRQTTKDVSLANQVKAALNEERQRGMGGAIGAVMDIASKPYTTLQRLAQIESQTKGVLNKITGGTRELVGVGAERGAPAASSVAGGKFFTSLLDGLRSSPGSAATAASAAGASTSRSAFERRVDQIGALQGNPLAVTDRVANALGPVGEASPSVVQQATGVALRGLDFLAGKLPPSRQDPYSLQPQLQPRTRASDAEISRYMRYQDAVDDPLIVLREAKTGTLTRDHVEAVQAVYPKLYDEMRGSVMRALVESKSELPYARRIQLGILLDLPTDKTLSPDFQKAIQATFPSVDQAGAESPPQTGAAPQVAGSMQTATQMAVERAS